MNVRKPGPVASSLHRVALLVAILQTCLPIANADYIPPSQVVVRTKAYHPEETEFPLGSYHYRVSWQGISVGSASVRIGTTQRDGKKMLDVAATACSGGVVGLFYKLRHRSESIFSAHELKPVEFLSQQTENSKFTNVTIKFSPDGLIDAKINKGRLNSRGQFDEVSFQSENATFDPISAAFLARSLPVDTSEDLSFDVFNGRDRYLISFHVVGREKIKLAGKEYDAFKVEPSVRKLTDSEGEKRLRKAYIWVTTDRSREILKLESKVAIGSVSAQLTGFVPDASPQTGINGARLECPDQNQ